MSTSFSAERIETSRLALERVSHNTVDLFERYDPVTREGPTRRRR